MNGSQAEPERLGISSLEGWRVSHNELRDIDTNKLGQEDQRWLFLTEDLFQASHSTQDLLLDAGWYPDSDPEGLYRIVLIRGGEWESPILAHVTRDTEEVIRTLETIMQSYLA